MRLGRADAWRVLASCALPLTHVQVTAIANDRESLLSFDGIDLADTDLWREASARATAGETYRGVEYKACGIDTCADTCLEMVTSHLIEVGHALVSSPTARYLCVVHQQLTPLFMHARE